MEPFSNSLTQSLLSYEGKNTMKKAHLKFENCREIKHPLLEHKLTLLRNKNSRAADFRVRLEEISSLLIYEITRDLHLKEDRIETPLEKMSASSISEDIILIPILRAGGGMLSGALKMLPFARVGHIGIYRDKFINNTVEYYFRIPKHAEKRRVILLDPLLATGDTAVAAINRLKEYDVGPISFACVLAAPAGIQRLKESHPDVSIACVSIERELTESGYILPGLGDAGDRLYDTV